MQCLCTSTYICNEHEDGLAVGSASPWMSYPSQLQPLDIEPSSGYWIGSAFVLLVLLVIALCAGARV